MIHTGDLLAQTEAGRRLAERYPDSGWTETIVEVEQEAAALERRTIWNHSHSFDAEAVRTGTCALGSFEGGCQHRISLDVR